MLLLYLVKYLAVDEARFLALSRQTQPPNLRSTGQSAVTLSGCGVKSGMVHSTCGCTCGWQVKLGDPSLTLAIPERLGGELLMIKRYTNRYFK